MLLFGMLHTAMELSDVCRPRLPLKRKRTRGKKEKKKRGGKLCLQIMSALAAMGTLAECMDSTCMSNHSWQLQRCFQTKLTQRRDKHKAQVRVVVQIDHKTRCLLLQILSSHADGECSEQQRVCLASTESRHLVRSHCVQHPHGLLHLLAGTPMHSTLVMSWQCYTKAGSHTGSH